MKIRFKNLSASPPICFILRLSVFSTPKKGERMIRELGPGQVPKLYPHLQKSILPPASQLSMVKLAWSLIS